MKSNPKSNERRLVTVEIEIEIDCSYTVEEMLHEICFCAGRRHQTLLCVSIKTRKRKKREV